MPADSDRELWVFAGLDHFIRHPRLWLRPLIASVVLGLCLLLALGGTVWWAWPTGTGWDLAWDLLALLGWLLAVLLLWYVVLVPLSMGLIYEALAARVLRDHGCATPGERFVAGLGSAVGFFVRTLHWRLGWLILGLLSLLLGPLAVVVGVLGATHIAIVDGLDIALACRGLPARQRLAVMRRHRGEIWANALVAAALQVVASLSFIGWLLVLPVLVTGCAIAAARWEVEADH